MINSDCPFCNAGLPPAVHKHYTPLRHPVTSIPTGQVLILSDRAIESIQAAIVNAVLDPDED